MRMRQSWLCVVIGLLCWMTSQILAPSDLFAEEPPSHLQRAVVFLKAGDYRQAAVRDRPSVRTYAFLTYVYHALDGYLEHL